MQLKRLASKSRNGEIVIVFPKSSVSLRECMANRSKNKQPHLEDADRPFLLPIALHL
ncbi:hypothetical protein AXF42_Ash021714 [Apostasia shenzhenica]|uniref:Uncharacterized protein n=1 Tax=Apostasia shenzhenica TaxID=1088818 RepID=A0A2H9ZYN1_9ASPA|nr:hypothetical protein AXF42_Ash021714 [Apostasia shenzhenica]